MDRDHAHGGGATCAGHHHGAKAQAQSCCGGKHDDGGKAAGAASATDPVCGMSVDPATAKHRFSYKTQDYFFCSARCRERFEAEPEKFLQPQHPQPAAPAGTIYTCPI